MDDDEPKNGRDASLDAELVRLVLEQKLCTQEEVDQCRALQHQDPAPLEELLVRQDAVTPGQINRLKRAIEESRHQQIPGYVILSKLGAGAMATVFMARQLSLDRIVAIKVLSKRLSENAEYVAMFYKEGKAAAKLNHANIVQAFDVGEAGGYHYFVMEYVEGHTVFAELDAGKVFDEGEALGIILQVARALHHAHERGLIHRDVKPKNIMLTTDGKVKLADMGLARLAADTKAAESEAGRAYGTPYYISPEQIRGDKDVDFRADIYSLGATLYHMVTGKVPFEGDSPVAVMQKHLKVPLVPPDHLNTQLSTGVAEVVEVMMAKEARHRYASTANLLLDLEAVAEGNPPLQARSRQIDADVLSGLAGGAESDSEALAPTEQTADLGPYLLLLLLALAVSVLLNILQFFR